MFQIHEVVDHERRCGWRKTGGYYFVLDKEAVISCPVLPIEIPRLCTHCGHEQRFSRAWQWVSGVLITRNADFSICTTCALEGDRKKRCVLMTLEPWMRVGLVWVGAIHYPTADIFSSEARAMGISRRLHIPPRTFIPCTTPVAFVHPRVRFGDPLDEEPIYSPAIVFVSRPRVEYVVSESDSSEKLQKIADKGIRLVRVLKQQTSIDDFIGAKNHEITAN